MRKTKTNFSFFLWHRRTGLLAIILIIIVSVTGIMLNHTKQLKLDSNYINQTILLNWYGIKLADKPSTYPITLQQKQHDIHLQNNQLFFDDTLIVQTQQSLKGIVNTKQFVVIALENEIILLTQNGELIERLSDHNLFSQISRIGKKQDKVVIESLIKSHQFNYFLADNSFSSWQVTENKNISWSTLANSISRNLQQNKVLTLERIVLDLHSGRIFGRYGIYLMDAAAIALLWLSFSGFLVWLRRRKKMQHKRHYQKHHRN